ncbi:MAG: iron-containing alcohol dehydrogenase [Clostridia bacterium]
MQRFLFPTEFYAGAGCIQELGRFICENDKVALITDVHLVKLGLAGKIENIIENLGASVKIFDAIPPNPHAEVVNSCRSFVEEMQATVVVCLGGGSPMDVAKVVAMLATNEGAWEDYQWNFKQPTKKPLPYIAIPTTAGTGSEATKTAVIIDRDTKKGVGGDFFFAKAALLDPELMVSLPPMLTATTGMDALTHAIEAYVGKNSQPFTDSLALEAISILAKYLPRAYANGTDLEARERVAVAASMAGLAMDQSGLGIIHSMSGPLSSHYDVPHGLSNAVLLPYGMEYNIMAVPEKFARIAAALGVDIAGYSEREAANAAVEKIEEMLEDMQIPADLCSYYKEEEDIQSFAEEACKMFLMRNNPRTPQVKDIAEIFSTILE